MPFRDLVTLISICVAASCGENNAFHNTMFPDIDISTGTDGIVPLPDNVPPVFADTFSKYSKVLAPNGKPIHMLAQSGWTDVQIIKVRNVLQYILTDFPGSAYGSDKTEVANAMADRKATMVLFNTEEDLDEALRGPLGEVTTKRK